MLRKNALLCTLLLTASTTSTPGITLKQQSIAQAEVLASVFFNSISTNLAWNIYDAKKKIYTTWKKTLKDPQMHIELASAVVSLVVGAILFNDACNRVNI